MSIRLDISQGVEPVAVYSDIRNDNYRVHVDGLALVFERLPFTLKDVLLPGAKRTVPCADKALVLKHRDKAVSIRELARQETVRG